MKLEIFAVKDRALDAFMRPWFAQSTGQAMRMFTDEINNPQGEMNKHPDDYDLWHIGYFLDNTGGLHQIEHGPKQLVLGKQVKDPALYPKGA